LPFKWIKLGILKSLNIDCIQRHGDLTAFTRCAFLKQARLAGAKNQ
jgi:hypothetical protein